MTYLVYIALFSYLLLMLYLLSGWQKATQTSTTPHLGVYPDLVSVLIPFSDGDIPDLRALISDLVEGRVSGALDIILIDDRVNRSEEVIDSIDCTIHQLVISEGQGKAAALHTGLSHATSEYVLTLDADVRLSPDWHKALIEVIGVEPKFDMLILPVFGQSSASLPAKYAFWDFASLIGVTFATAAQQRPIMANGAQLLMRRSLADWSEVRVSGDDVFAVHRLKQHAKTIIASTDERLIARTAMPSTWSDVLSQRLRWASKSSDYTDKDTLVLGWFTVVFHLLLWMLLIGSLWQGAWIYLFLVAISTKWIMDGYFLSKVMRWSKASYSWLDYAWVSVLNLLQYPLVALLSPWKSYTWKERTYP